MTPVYSQGLSSEIFWTMVEKMMIVLTTFASKGSGWVPEKVIKTIVKFARYRPLTGSSYIALPSKLQNCKITELCLVVRRRPCKSYQTYGDLL